MFGFSWGSKSKKHDDVDPIPFLYSPPPAPLLPSSKMPKSDTENSELIAEERSSTPEFITPPLEDLPQVLDRLTILAQDLDLDHKTYKETIFPILLIAIEKGAHYRDLKERLFENIAIDNIPEKNLVKACLRKASFRVLMNSLKQGKGENGKIAHIVSLHEIACKLHKSRFLGAENPLPQTLPEELPSPSFSLMRDP